MLFYPDALGSLLFLSVSLYPHILASDLVFHFLPAACTGYPFWSCVPGCDHSKLHGKFYLIYFNFTSGESQSPVLFWYYLKLFPCFWVLVPGRLMSPWCCMDFVLVLSSIHCLKKQSFLFLWVAALFLSYPHFVKISPCVFVTHLLASESHVLVVVWSGVNLCLC